MTIGPVPVWLGLGRDPSCADSPSVVDAANARIDNVSGPAGDTYPALLKATNPAGTSPSGTSIIVADYPHLFPDSASEQSCLALSGVLTTQDEQYFNQAANRLDGILQDAARSGGSQFRRCPARVQRTRDLRQRRGLDQRHQLRLGQLLLHMDGREPVRHTRNAGRRLVPSQRHRSVRWLRCRHPGLHQRGHQPDARGIPGQPRPVSRPVLPAPR